MSAPSQKLNRLCKRILTALALPAIIALTALSPQAALGASVTTDQLDYPPFSFVTITGAGFQAGETVNNQVVQVSPSPASYPAWTVPADTSGGFTTTWYVFTDDLIGATLQLTSTGQSSGLTATASFTDANCVGAANLDQARNGGESSPVSPVDLQNGNLGEQQAHYREGHSVPYRAVLTDLPVGESITLTLGFDIKHSDRHALDYLTHYNRLSPHLFDSHTTPETVNPLVGLTGFPSTFTTFAIPAPTSVNSPVPNQPTTSFNALPASERLMTLYGGTITAIAYVVPGGQGDLTASQSEAQVNVTFTPTSANAVLAWGGHIASRLDWGVDAANVPRSASGITGSPYHMRLKDWVNNNEPPCMGNLGNQDRSLSAKAVIPPPVCEDVTISGTTPVCPGSSQTHTASITANCTNPQISWTISGNGTIVTDPPSGPTITVRATGCGSYELCATFTCAQGTVSCCKTFNVVDTTAPVISELPGPSSVECPATPVFTTPTATDACDTSVTPTFVDVRTDGACPQEYSVTRTWTATDDCLNSSTKSQTISVTDNTAPTISALPGPSSIECPATPVFTTPTATDACDTSVTPTFVDVRTDGACPQEYSVTRTWTATDDCGNSSTRSQTISVTDNTAPVISALPGPSSVECPATPVFTTPTATDACDTSVTPTFVDVRTDGGCPQEYSVTRTWTATDDCGNSSTRSQTISVTDNTAPVISALPGPSSVECPATPVFTTPTATDACDTSVTPTFVDVRTDGGCPQEYSVTRTWTATDDCGNSSTRSQTISVTDNTAPVISALPGPSSVECPATPVFTTPTATDACDTSVTPTFVDVRTDGGCPQEYSVTRTWTATDDCGNSSTKSQTISVTDNTAPTISALPGPSSVECPATPNFTTPTATDACDTSVTPTFVDVRTDGGCPQEYSVTRTWTATDDCGNSSTRSQTISVTDNTPPTLNCQSATYTTCVPPTITKPTATDLCDPNPTVISKVNGVVVTTLPTTFAPGTTTTIEFQAKDACNNYSDKCTIVVTVPVLTASVADVSGCLGQTVSFVGSASVSAGSLSASMTWSIQIGQTTLALNNGITGVTITPNGNSSTLTINLATFNGTGLGTGNYGIILDVTDTVTGCTDSALAALGVTPCSFVTNTERCLFDYGPGPCPEEGLQQFRLIFTQDSGASKLNASNPGQWFYNVTGAGAPGTPAKFLITLPYPFVTQGANPVHGYDSIDQIIVNGQTCFVPGNAVYVSSQQVVLGDYDSQEIGIGNTTSFKITTTFPAKGFLFIAIHIDYGLKGSVNYKPDGDGNARDATSDAMRIPQCQEYTFQVDPDGCLGDALVQDQTIQSFNKFKKNPGVGGLTIVSSTLSPSTGNTAKLLNASKKLVVSGASDEDGWYILNYKHTGKAATFYVELTTPGGYKSTKQVSLKANEYLQVDFSVP